MFCRLILAASISSLATAEVYRCSEGGKTVYSDKPCGTEATKLPIRADGPDSPRGKSKLGPPGTKLQVSENVAKECFDGYRVLARDPTTVKKLYTTAAIAPNGLPFIDVVVIVTNNFAAPTERGFGADLRTT